jgi:hypothetical protein
LLLSFFRFIPPFGPHLPDVAGMLQSDSTPLWGMDDRVQYLFFERTTQPMLRLHGLEWKGRQAYRAVWLPAERLSVPDIVVQAILCYTDSVFQQDRTQRSLVQQPGPMVLVN